MPLIFLLKSSPLHPIPQAHLRLEFNPRIGLVDYKMVLYLVGAVAMETVVLAAYLWVCTRLCPSMGHTSTSTNTGQRRTR